MKPLVLVPGATGQVGLFTIDRLLESGYRVVAITRHGDAHEKTATTDLCRVTIPNLPGALVNEPSVSLVSCGPVGLARKLIEDFWPDFAGLDRVVIVATTSTRSKAASPIAEEREQIAEIEAGLERIRDVCEKKQARLAILSPTLIYGCGLDQNISRMYRWIKRFGFAPLATNANGLRQPLHVADLALTLVNALRQDGPGHIESPVCGADPISYADMIALLFDAAQRKRRMLRLPGLLVTLAVGASRLVPGVGDINREMFRRQSQDLVFDDGVARTVLHHVPRQYRPTEKDFRLPLNIEHIRRSLF